MGRIQLSINKRTDDVTEVIDEWHPLFESHQKRSDKEINVEGAAAPPERSSKFSKTGPTSSVQRTRGDLRIRLQWRSNVTMLANAKSNAKTQRRVGWFENVIMGKTVGHFISFCIVLNSIAMASEHYGMSNAAGALRAATPCRVHIAGTDS